MSKGQIYCNKAQVDVPSACSVHHCPHNYIFPCSILPAFRWLLRDCRGIRSAEQDKRNCAFCTGGSEERLSGCVVLVHWRTKGFVTFHFFLLPTPAGCIELFLSHLNSGLFKTLVSDFWVLHVLLILHKGEFIHKAMWHSEMLEETVGKCTSM